VNTVYVSVHAALQVTFTNELVALVPSYRPQNYQNTASRENGNYIVLLTIRWTKAWLATLCLIRLRKSVSSLREVVIIFIVSRSTLPIQRYTCWHARQYQLGAFSPSGPLSATTVCQKSAGHSSLTFFHPAMMIQ
jgi:hypothetical protein